MLLRLSKRVVQVIAVHHLDMKIIVKSRIFFSDKTLIMFDFYEFPDVEWG